MFSDRAEGQGRQESQAADQQDGHGEQADEQRTMGRETVRPHRAGLLRRGLVQSVALSGNRNLVQNLAALEVMLKDRPGADPALNCAWEQLRALRPSGY